MSDHEGGDDRVDKSRARINEYRLVFRRALKAWAEEDEEHRRMGFFIDLIAAHLAEAFGFAENEELLESTLDICRDMAKDVVKRLKLQESLKQAMKVEQSKLVH